MAAAGQLRVPNLVVEYLLHVTYHHHGGAPGTIRWTQQLQVFAAVAVLTSRHHGGEPGMILQMQQQQQQLVPVVVAMTFRRRGDEPDTIPQMQQQQQQHKVAAVMPLELLVLLLVPRAKPAWQMDPRSGWSQLLRWRNRPSGSVLWQRSASACVHCCVLPRALQLVQTRQPAVGPLAL